MHVTNIFHFCWEAVCCGGKNLDLETNQSGLESELHHFLLVTLSKLSSLPEPQFPVVETFWGDFSVQPSHFSGNFSSHFHMFNVMGLLVLHSPVALTHPHLGQLDQGFGSDPKWASPSLFSRNLEFQS